MIIKQFEAFKSKDISSISKFLKNMDGDDAYDFISDLSAIAEELDKPVSIFGGKYMSGVAAARIPGKDKSVQENYLKFWFSLKDGYLGKTISRKDSPSSYCSNIMNKNGILDDSQMNIIKERFYNKGVIEPIVNYKSLKTGDEVIFVASPGGNPISAIVYVEVEDDYVQVYLLQNTYKDTVRVKNAEEILKKYNKAYTYRIFRKYIDEYNKEYKIGHLSLLKYTKTDDEIHQDLSHTQNEILNKIFFLNNNKVCNEYLRTHNWSEELYDKFSSADYSLVIDLENLDNVKLSDIKAQRKDNSPDPIKNDNYYKKINRNRWEDKLGRNIKSKATDDQLRKLKDESKYRFGYNNRYDDVLIDTLLDMYNNGQINSSQLDMILAHRR